jgi:hypothetical protein
MVEAAKRKPADQDKEPVSRPASGSKTVIV